jgi:hypothetical protein
VVFVFYGKVLCGVIHISDLNRKLVINALQNYSLSFERNLRQFYLLNGVSNQSIIEFFDYRAKKSSDFYKKKFKDYSRDDKNEQFKKMVNLQHFYLNDLILYGNRNFASKLFVTNEMDNRLNRYDDEIINSLSNGVMNTKDSIDTKTLLKLNSEKNLNEFKTNMNLFGCIYPTHRPYD